MCPSFGWVPVGAGQLTSLCLHQCFSAYELQDLCRFWWYIKTTVAKHSASLLVTRQYTGLGPHMVGIKQLSSVFIVPRSSQYPCHQKKTIHIKKTTDMIAIYNRSQNTSCPFWRMKHDGIQVYRDWIIIFPPSVSCLLSWLSNTDPAMPTSSTTRRNRQTAVFVQSHHFRIARPFTKEWRWKFFTHRRSCCLSWCRWIRDRHG